MNTEKIPSIGGVGLMAGALACVGLMSAGTALASTVTISGSGWDSAGTQTNSNTASTAGGWAQVGAASNGLSYGAYASRGSANNSASAGYSSSNGGSAELSITATSGSSPEASANISGPNGQLQYTSMSFVTAGFSGTSGWEPYAGLQLGSFDLIGTSSTIDSSSNVGVWDPATSSWYDGYSITDPVQLSDLDSISAGTTNFGNLTVEYGFAAMGGFTTDGSATAYITSMQMSDITPIPGSGLLAAVGGSALIGGLALRRRMAKLR
ncbi:MAG: hypothetical protein ACP5I8_16595 [Phycisphaerae bacterium]